MTSPQGMEDECGTLEIYDHHDPIWGNQMQSAWMPDDAICQARAVCGAYGRLRDLIANPAIEIRTK